MIRGDLPLDGWGLKTRQSRAAFRAWVLSTWVEGRSADRESEEQSGRGHRSVFDGAGQTPQGDWWTPMPVHHLGTDSFLRKGDMLLSVAHSPTL